MIPISKKKILIAAIIFALIASSGLAKGFPPFATPTTESMHILPDGTIVPATAPISRIADVYTLTNNVNDASLVIERDNIVVDGAGFGLRHSSSDFNAGSSVTGVSMIGRTNVTLKNVGIYQWGDCIDVANSTNLTIENNSLSNVGFGFGMLFINSSNIKILENTVRSLAVLDRQTIGIWLMEGRSTLYSGECSNFTISRNTISEESTGLTGIRYSVVCLNDISLCQTGFTAGDSNEIFANNLHDMANYAKGEVVPHRGTALKVGFNNTVYANNFTGNGVGVSLGEASGCTFYGNNFAGTTLHDVELSSDTLPNVWDNGTYGNYWSNYKYAYSYAKEVDDTGTGNVPYTLSGNNIDRHPLLDPISMEQALKITNPQPTPAPTPTPTASPTPSPSVPEFPSSTNSPSSTKVPGEFVVNWAEPALAVVVLAVGGLAAYFLRRSHKRG